MTLDWHKIVALLYLEFKAVSEDWGAKQISRKWRENDDSFFERSFGRHQWKYFNHGSTWCEYAGIALRFAGYKEIPFWLTERGSAEVIFSSTSEEISYSLLSYRSDLQESNKIHINLNGTDDERLHKQFPSNFDQATPGTYHEYQNTTSTFHPELTTAQCVEVTEIWTPNNKPSKGKMSVLVHSNLFKLFICLTDVSSSHCNDLPEVLFDFLCSFSWLRTGSKHFLSPFYQDYRV